MTSVVSYSSNTNVYAYSSDRLYLAMTQTIVSSNSSSRILVYQVTPSAFPHQVVMDYVPPSSVTCLTWQTTPSLPLLAIGLSNGQVQLYHVMKGQVHLTLSLHTAMVTQCVFHPDLVTLFTGSLDGWIGIWDCQTGEMKSKFKPSAAPSNMVLSSDSKSLAVANTSVTVYTNLSSQRPKEVIQFSSHASPITLMCTSPSHIVCTSTYLDRCIQRHAWDATRFPSYTFTSSVISIELHPLHGHTVALGKDGKLYLWNPSEEENFNKSMTQTTKKSNSRKTFAPHSVLEIQHSDDKNVLLGITSCAFTQDDRLVITWGKDLDPRIELLDYLDDKGQLLPSRILYRTPSTVHTMTSDPSIVPAPVTPVCQVIDAHQLPSTHSSHPLSFHTFADQLKELASVYKVPDQPMTSTTPSSNSSTLPPSTSDPSTAVATSTPSLLTPPQSQSTTPTSSKKISGSFASNVSHSNSSSLPPNLHEVVTSQHVNLIQALKTNDLELLESVLAPTSLPKDIMSTVQHVPLTWVIPFMMYLLTKMKATPSRANVLMAWVHALLVQHSSYLLTVPDLAHVLAPLYQYFQQRARHAFQFQTLLGRVDFILQKKKKSHAAQRHPTSHPPTTTTSSSSSSLNSLNQDPSNRTTPTSSHYPSQSLLSNSPSSPSSVSSSSTTTSTSSSKLINKSPQVVSYALHENAIYEDVSYPTAGTTLRHVFPKASTKTWKQLANDGLMVDDEEEQEEQEQEQEDQMNVNTKKGKKTETKSHDKHDHDFDMSVDPLDDKHEHEAEEDETKEEEDVVMVKEQLDEEYDTSLTDLETNDSSSEEESSGEEEEDEDEDDEEL
ncbi:WD repeat-containing protein 43 [Coelomomyces lativittatus]|nr:WD repeat-containing protein 43 [Coelomomyces lativittatus]